MISVRNDIASIIQTKGRILITPHVFHDNTWQPCEETYEFDKDELTYMLALYSSFARDKKKGATI